MNLIRLQSSSHGGGSRHRLSVQLCSLGIFACIDDVCMYALRVATVFTESRVRVRGRSRQGEKRAGRGCDNN
jgi:hypothetical protein